MYIYIYILYMVGPCLTWPLCCMTSALHIALCAFLAKAASAVSVAQPKAYGRVRRGPTKSKTFCCRGMHGIHSHMVHLICTGTSNSCSKSSVVPPIECEWHRSCGQPCRSCIRVVVLSSDLHRSCLRFVGGSGRRDGGLAWSFLQLNLHDSVPWHIHCAVLGSEVLSLLLESDVLSPLAAMWAYCHGCAMAYRLGLRRPWWLKLSQGSVLLRARIEPKWANSQDGMADEKHDADDADGKHESGMARRGYSICKRAESGMARQIL